MIQISVPGRAKTLDLKYLLLDLNGTLTVGGVLPPGVKERVELLKNKLDVYLLTADTFGSGKEVAEELGIEIFKVNNIKGADDKKDFLIGLEAEKTVAIGNGYNDVLMLENAGLSMVIIGGEGCCVQALMRADIAVNNIIDALDLLMNPLRIVATLRA